VRNIDLVAFDLDDTLYLEREYVRSGFQAVDSWISTELGIEGFGKRCWSLFADGIRGTVFDQALEGMGATMTSDLVKTLRNLYRSHVPAITLEPDAAECLQMLHDRRLAVVTDGPVQGQRAKVAALGLARFVEWVVYTDELGQDFGKPSTKAFELLEERHGAKGTACLYVADNPVKDFLGPTEIGWNTCRVRRPGSLHETIESGHDVDFEVEDLLPLSSLLRHNHSATES
jgi:putative hydrolase of the HAD superfamily